MPSTRPSGGGITQSRSACSMTSATGRSRTVSRLLLLHLRGKQLPRVRHLRHPLKRAPGADVGQALALRAGVIGGQIAERHARPLDIDLRRERLGGALGRDPARSDQADRLRQEDVLGRVDRVLERVPVAAGGTGTARWRIGGPVSTPSSTKWTVTPVTSTPASRAWPIASRPGKDGQESRVDVHDPVAPALDELRREQLHVAGEDDQVDLVPGEPFGDRGVALLAAVEAVAREALGRDARVRRAVEGHGAGLVRGDRHDLEPSRPCTVSRIA